MVAPQLSGSSSCVLLPPPRRTVRATCPTGAPTTCGRDSRQSWRRVAVHSCARPVTVRLGRDHGQEQVGPVRPAGVDLDGAAVDVRWPVRRVLMNPGTAAC